MQKLLIAKTRDVKTPTRGTDKSAGLDFYVPNDFPGTHYLAQGQDVNIPSGIKVRVPENTALIVKNKSGQALKKGLQVGACVIDEDYQGEIHIHVRNIGLDVVEIKPGEKLVQVLIIPIIYLEPELVNDEDLFEETTIRGDGAFGSTGTE